MVSTPSPDGFYSWQVRGRTLTASPDGFYIYIAGSFKAEPLLPALMGSIAGKFESEPSLPALMGSIAGRFESEPLLPALMVSIEHQSRLVVGGSRWYKPLPPHFHNCPSLPHLSPICSCSLHTVLSLHSMPFAPLRTLVQISNPLHLTSQLQGFQHIYSYTVQ